MLLTGTADDMQEASKRRESQLFEKELDGLHPGQQKYSVGFDQRVMKPLTLVLIFQSCQVDFIIHLYRFSFSIISINSQNSGSFFIRPRCLKGVERWRSRRQKGGAGASSCTEVEEQAAAEEWCMSLLQRGYRRWTSRLRPEGGERAEQPPRCAGRADCGRSQVGEQSGLCGVLGEQAAAIGSWATGAGSRGQHASSAGSWASRHSKLYSQRVFDLGSALVSSLTVYLLQTLQVSFQAFQVQ
ncbi:hypothetical protein PR202_ga20444 [Eleusine coracana subsp. coracana]|uniref:Uncharacterized protein n=1 Tax=Eleusine coracana subsp. coracana TaxID=191504 RepID=A0AAV5CXW8_ELECO|nr:hypothetical protein PR202_ga20444 [Eleusine coracana subsp. coracana]